jgi:predicted metal-dependent peptidase
MMSSVPSMTSPVETKLAAARTRLILEHPFIGALLMHLPFEASSPVRCPTLATDARRLYFNPGYFAGLTLAETQFVLAHEALHCALAHFARRSHRVRKRWDVACDHAVNLILIQEGMRPPPGVLANADFVGLTAEEIYPLIPPDTAEAPLDGHLFDHAGAGRGDAEGRSLRARAEEMAPSGAPVEPPQEASRSASDDGWDDAGDAGRCSVPGDEARPVGDRRSGDLEALAQRWQSRFAAAAHAAMQAGRLSNTLARSLEHLIQPRMPWQALLARFLVSVARDDYSFRRSSRREGDAVLPRLASGELNVFLVIDTSGSIGEEELREFASEINALKGQVRANLVLHACDQQLSADGPWHFAPWEPVTLPATLSGGGGTRFTPVFEWIEREQQRPDVLVYFTDALGEFPQEAPSYPVIWLVKGRAEVPWGERVQLN